VKISLSMQLHIAGEAMNSIIQLYVKTIRQIKLNNVY